MGQKYTSVHLSHGGEKQGGGVGMKRRWRTRASCAAREHVSWAGGGREVGAQYSPVGA